jgi:hypothetical protein
MFRERLRVDIDTGPTQSKRIGRKVAGGSRLSSCSETGARAQGSELLRLGRTDGLERGLACDERARQ